MMLSKVVVIGLIGFTACSQPNTSIEFQTPFMDMDSTLEDIRDEYDRVKQNVEETLYKANMDTLDTAAKANMDVVEEGHRVADNIEETAAKANMDVIEEEHRASSNTKETAAKANSDFLDEKARVTDKLVGSDDTQLSEHSRRIEALEDQAKY